MGKDKKQDALIAEYEWLRQFGKALDRHSNAVDARLVEIERELPDHYVFPGDPRKLDERR